MPAPGSRSELRVEGINDVHVIGNLIKHYGIDYTNNPLAPVIVEKRGIKPLLDVIEPAIESSGGRIFGFVLDADDSPADRWAGVRQRLMNTQVADVPAEPPEGGFIGESPKFKSRVGVWLMPDNRRSGALELFLRDLVPEHDPVIDHARSSTEQAKGLGAGFRPIDALKATIHCWLAWQENPGRPYGTAITCKYFDHEHPTARQFVEWFKSLYQIHPVA